MLAVDVDRDLLLSAAGNLLQNAFKFSHPNSEISLNAYAVADRILIDVEDQCGGLPPGDAEKMFLPFMQDAEDRSGLGLGLSISRRSIEATAASSAFETSQVPGAFLLSTCHVTRCRKRRLPLPNRRSFSSTRSAFATRRPSLVQSVTP